MTGSLGFDDDTAFSLADDAATISALVRRAGPERLRDARFGEWTALQLIAHLADSAEIFAERVRRCVEEHEPVIESFDPDARMGRFVQADADPMVRSGRLAVEILPWWTAYGSMPGDTLK